MDIFIKAHPYEASGMLKYMSTIQVGFPRNTSGWREYDFQYRLRKGADPSSSWAQTDSELAVVYGTAFNFSGFGCKQQCDSSHLCKRCNFDQPMPVCPKLKVSTQQPPSCPVNFRPKPNLSAYPKKRYGEPGTNIIPRQPFPVPSAPQQVQGYGAVAKPQSNKKFKIGIYRGIQTKEAAKLLSDGFYFRFNLC